MKKKNPKRKKRLISRKVPCSTCHSNATTHGEFIATKKTCADCHHSQSQKDCISCHVLQKTTYQGGTWNGLQVPADIMFAAGAECTDCHHNTQGNVIRSGAEKCLDCHEEDYRELFTEWQNSYQELSTSIRDSLQKLNRQVLSRQDKSDLAEIQNILENIELDGSKGIHNFQFFEETLSNIQKRITTIRDNIYPRKLKEKRREL